MLRPSTIQNPGEFLQWFRAKHNLTIIELAKETNVSKQFISRFEKDEYDLALPFLRALCKILTREEKEILVESIARSIREKLINQ